MNARLSDCSFMGVMSLILPSGHLYPCAYTGGLRIREITKLLKLLQLGEGC